VAISTETVVLKIEGQTDGAVRATDKLASSQRKLKAEVQSTSKAMAGLTPPQTATRLSQLGDALKAAGVDANTFSSGLRDIGKGLVFDKVRQGLKSLNTDLNSASGAALSAATNGAAMGAAFGGPLGAAIGGAAGALVGLIRHTDQQSAASLRAAEAAKKHAAALKLIAQGETTARVARRSTREEFDKASKENLRAFEIVQDQIKKFGVASEGARADLERARRALEDAEDARAALNKAGGQIWLEERVRLRDKARAIEDVTAARQHSYITDIEAQKRLDDLNGVEAKAIEVIEKRTSSIKRSTEARYANVQAALDAQGATRSTDTAGRVIGFSTQLGAVADTTQRDKFGFEKKIDTAKLLDGHEQRLRSIKKIKKDMATPTLLQQLGLDDPSAMETAATAAQAFANSYGATMTAIAMSSMTATDAFKVGIGSLVSALGDKLYSFAASEAVAWRQLHSCG
jgi:hypothetical protein